MYGDLIFFQIFVYEYMYIYCVLYCGNKCFQIYKEIDSHLLSIWMEYDCTHNCPFDLNMLNIFIDSKKGILCASNMWLFIWWKYVNWLVCLKNSTTISMHVIFLLILSLQTIGYKNCLFSWIHLHEKNDSIWERLNVCILWQPFLKYT